MAIPKFKNEPFTDFSKKSNRKDFQKALTKIKERFGKEFPIIIGSEEIYTDEKSASYNPSKPEEIIGVFQRGTPEIGDKAITIAYETFQTWKNVPAKKR